MTDTKKTGPPTGPGLGISCHEATDRDDATATDRLDDYPDFAEVAYQAIANLVHVCQMDHGPVPEPGTAEWFEAGWLSQAASVAAAFLGELPGQPVVAEKQAATAISAALDWSEASRNPSYATLAARRAEPGVMARTVDSAAAARWARTGSSAEVGA